MCHSIVVPYPMLQIGKKTLHDVIDMKTSEFKYLSDPNLAFLINYTYCRHHRILITYVG